MIKDSWDHSGMSLRYSVDSLSTIIGSIDLTMSSLFESMRSLNTRMDS